MKKIFISLLFSSLAALWGWQSYQTARNTPLVTERLVVLHIEKGDSINTIIQKLQAQQIPVSAFWFKWFAQRDNLARRLKFGEYELKIGLTLPEMLHLLATGKAHQYTVTFPEGWTFKQILQRLAQQPDLKHTLQNKDSKSIMAELCAETQSPEGMFFPATYFFTKEASDFSILKKAYAKMQTVLQSEWEHRAADLPLKTPYEALILASIVEKETADSAERPMIAGVFTQRLKIGMRLQTDPTVIYGMGERYQGNLRKQDLQTPTVYNTYLIKGLPPTPIAMPGKAAIQAVLHPTQTNNLYFVARGNGTHVFSSTLEAHNQAVNQFQRHLK